MFCSELDFRCSPGLNQLEKLRRQGNSLFQGDRAPGPVDEIYPSIPVTSFNPCWPRGTWIPKIGFLPPCLLVRDVFSSPVAAAMLALTQAPDGGRSFRTEGFSDGTVMIAVGESPTNRSDFAGLLRRASALRDRDLLGDYFVNVLPRSAFEPDRLDFPCAGNYVSPDAVRVEARVQLTAGDLRVLAGVLGPELPWLSDSIGVRADPFTGPYSTGGHMQFDSDSGEMLARIREPTDMDRRSALTMYETRGFRWLEKRVRRPPPEALGSSTKSFTQLRPSALQHALQFIDDNCTRPINVADIAAAARLSTSRVHRLFRSAIGCTPLGYASKRRLDVAERLLIETSMNVAEIAEQCGFAEQTSLTRSLRRQRGITPLALRRSATRGPPPAKSQEGDRADDDIAANHP
jgi:AraC-like DNA-binding protein